MSIGEIITVITFSLSIIGEMVAVFKIIKNIANGTKCQLRTDMLNMYYLHKDEKEWREYERENYDKLYDAYKALKGNSFIDDVTKEVREWSVIR